jgi:hypothetical protein
MACAMLDALRHRLVQNVQTQHVNAAPPLNIKQHAPAPHCIPGAQCQKPSTAQKNLNFTQPYHLAL